MQNLNLKMSPIDCMKLQLDRSFSCTLGCAEHEEIGKRVLLDLCFLNRWDSYLFKSRYPQDLWLHAIWIGEEAIEESFSEWIIFHPYNPDRFQVSDDFIAAMHFSEII